MSFNSLKTSLLSRVCDVDDPFPHKCCRNPTTGGWRAVKLVDGTLCSPSKEGWGDGTYVVVLSTPKPSSDANGGETESGAGYSVASAPAVGKFCEISRHFKLHCRVVLQ